MTFLNTKFGKVECMKFRPYVQSGRVFKEQESVTLWISNDKNKIPVKMKADLKIGAIECDLENFKNLRGIADAKGEMINNIIKGGKIILNRDDKYFKYLKKTHKF